MNATKKNKIVLTLLLYYEPGYKAGGPITTVINSIRHLKDYYDFKVVTSDRDLGDSGPYPLPTGRWLGRLSDTLYLAPGSYRLLLRILRDTEYDVLYLNSFFSFRFSIAPMIWAYGRKRFKQKIVLAPRGEFSNGALSIKPFKKRLYLACSKLLNLYEHVVWQASSEGEKAEIRRLFGLNARISVVSDLPTVASERHEVRARNKRGGELRLVFLSRISRMKNLDFALKSLREVPGDVVFHIYGPIEDESYWKYCLELIGKLPPNISVEYKGALRHQDVRTCLEQYELFYLPTRGEGFGHAILEAMQSGCPLLLSDRSPWNDIVAYGAGFVYPLDHIGAFSDQIQKFVAMEAKEYDSFSRQALNYSRTYADNKHVLEAHLSLFE